MNKYELEEIKEWEAKLAPLLKRIDKFTKSITFFKDEARGCFVMNIVLKKEGYLFNLNDDFNEEDVLNIFRI